MAAKATILPTAQAADVLASLPAALPTAAISVFRPDTDRVTE